MKPTYEELQQQLENVQRELRSADITMQNLEAQLKQSKIDADCYKKGMESSNARLVQLAAENAGLKANLMYWDAENPEAPYDTPCEIAEACSLNYSEEFVVQVAAKMPNRTYRVCESWEQECRLELVEGAEIETPATDAFLAEVRTSAIPEGYVLVPQQIFLEPSDIESICSQCGDGHESGYGDFTDGLLWIGNIQRDDGSIVHGLHISSADYSEEGGVTVCEFAAQLRKGVQS